MPQIVPNSCQFGALFAALAAGADVKLPQAVDAA